MQGPAHLGLGWLMGQAAGLQHRRDRRIVGLAGLVPDVDVVVYPLAYLAFLGDLDQAFALYAQVHHRYTHGVLFGLLCAVAAWRLATARSRGLVAALTLAAVLVHIGADVIASGPAWPVYPLAPFHDLALTVDWSWNATDWRNTGLSLLAIGMALWYSGARGYSALECFSYRADDWMAAVLRGEARSSARFRIVLYGALLVVSLAVILPLWFYRA